MNADEKEIYEFLSEFGQTYVSCHEVCKRLGHSKRYEIDRTWARPILRRMELDQLVESNPFGEYRLLSKENDTARFKKAIEVPGATLGDTTIITLDDVSDQK